MQNFFLIPSISLKKEKKFGSKNQNLCIFQIDLQKLKVQDDKSFNTKHFKPQVYIFIPSANAIYE